MSSLKSILYDAEVCIKMLETVKYWHRKNKPDCDVCTIPLHDIEQTILALEALKERLDETNNMLQKG
jgi:hypothetical protein